MNINRTFSYIILLALTCNSANAQKKIVKNKMTNTMTANHKKENALGQNIFKAFKEKSSDNWVNLYPTNAEYKNILQQMLAAKIDGLTQEAIDTMLAQREKEAAAYYSVEFTNFCKQADSLGLAWKNAVFEKFDFIAAYPEKVKLKYLNGDIQFKCGNEHYIIADIEALEIETGYKLQSVKGIKKINN